MTLKLNWQGVDVYSIWLNGGYAYERKRHIDGSAVCQRHSGIN
ncbi:hypothetical protein MNV_1620002 [Candidatus Methanoperedens nitroreducens]|uniref:Uncharacterized protein n=1 Tax=Candidatus Methanoperedens nitratireducens TaxID=1392998 RepID=A0A284VLJ0_9EURY|nr:hypothetical protein MNV_1620002 [Candidatus Methanoperedens nitroreducens]